MRMRSSLSWTILLVCWGLAPAAGQETRYSAVFLGDVKIGHMRERREATSEQVVHESDFELSLRRGTVQMDLSIATRTVETPQGRPVSFSSDQSLGPLGRRATEGVIRDGKIHLTTTSMGQTRQEVVDYPAGALMPEALQRRLRQSPLQTGATGEYLLFDVENLGGAKVQYAIGRPESVAVGGQIERLWPMETKFQYGPQTVTAMSWVDRQYQVRKMELPLLGMTLQIVACDEQFARSPNGQVDFLARSTVASPVPIENARQLRAARFSLKPRDAGTVLELPVSDVQTVRKNDDGTLEVSVRLSEPSSPGRRPYEGDEPSALAALQPGRYVQSTHPQIVQQARRIVEGQDGALPAARAIEQWVARHVKTKDLSVGYASALETLQGGQGDCTEHAVLTAALCRAAGVPCRIVVGVAYTDQFGDQAQRFIGHAWNEAFVDGQWVPLDAALSVDAARIALAAGGGDPADFIAMINTLGNFEITDAQGQP